MIPSDFSFGYLSAERKSPVKIPIPDAYLDGDLFEERLAVWQERLADPPRNQCVRPAVDGSDLQGFVCVYGGKDSKLGSFIHNLHVTNGFKRGGVGSSLMRQAGVWLTGDYGEVGIYLWVFGGERLRETILRAPRRPELQGVSYQDQRGRVFFWWGESLRSFQGPVTLRFV